MIPRKEMLTPGDIMSGDGFAWAMALTGGSHSSNISGGTWQCFPEQAESPSDTQYLSHNHTNTLGPSYSQIRCSCTQRHRELHKESQTRLGDSDNNAPSHPLTNKAATLLTQSTQTPRADALSPSGSGVLGQAAGQAAR